MAVSLLIVDDHEGFREIAVSMFSAAGFDVVGAVGGVADALVEAGRVHPDVVLVDIRLPDGEGFDLVAPLHGQGSVVVLISSRSAADYGDRVERCGADGFVTKDELSGRRLRAIVGTPNGAGR